MKRKIWLGLYTLFFRMIPEHFVFGWHLRNFAVRHFIESSGKDIDIGYGARIHRNTVLGEHSGVGRDCEIMDQVTIGSNVMMGPNVYICTETHNFSDCTVPMQFQGMKPTKGVVIEDDVWIGTRVIIVPGVTIGHGSVIGAGAIVTKDIPPWSVAVGNPARVVKSRKE